MRRPAFSLQLLSCVVGSSGATTVATGLEPHESRSHWIPLRSPGRFTGGFRETRSSVDQAGTVGADAGLDVFAREPERGCNTPAVMQTNAPLWRETDLLAAARAGERCRGRDAGSSGASVAGASGLRRAEPARYVALPDRHQRLSRRTREPTQAPAPDGLRAAGGRGGGPGRGPGPR